MRTPILLLFFLPLTSQGQTTTFQPYNIPASQSGQPYKSPWVGGLNNPELSAVDLNNDGIPDLVVFDRGGNVLLTYINDHINGQVSYTYAPKYEANFPPMTDFVLLRDFDKDGAADIFCSAQAISSQEVQVFKGYFDSSNMLKFKPFKFSYPQCPTCDPQYIWYPDPFQPAYWNNLAVAKTDIPAVDDIDGDGDLDILCFLAGTSTNVSWFRNMSVEKGYGLDSLIFTEGDVCWGGFYENGLEPCRACLSPQAGTCCDGSSFCCHGFAPDPDSAVTDRNTRHPGATLMTYDQDGDGRKELVLGNISFSCLGFFTNGGTANQAWMTALDTAFPSYDVPVYLPDFPASYYLDLDNDGKNDMVVTPNSRTIGEDRKNVWFYKNTAATGHHFQLQNKRVLVQDMIDMGTATHPTFADVNGDGLLDIVVGNYGYFTANTPNNASLYLYLNTGTASAPAYNLVDSDWLNMSQYAPNDFDFAPAFGDIDGDGDLDLLIGSNSGGLYCFRNTAGPDAPMILQQDFNPMWLTMDVGVASTPSIIDLNQDGLPDVVMGERQGNINYFENIGNASTPLFANLPTIQKIGGVDTDEPGTSIGFSAPFFIPCQSGFMMVAGTQGGNLQAFNNATATSGPFDLISMNWGNVDVGSRSSPALADIDDDGTLEMVVGNVRGGLNLYKTVLTSCLSATRENNTSMINLTIAPNPSSDWARIALPEQTGTANWKVYDVLGRTRAEGASTSVINIQVRDWTPGIYFVDVVASGRRGIGKLVVKCQN